ncbi:unnamed protein product [Albugo candida]|uniref:Uncharacterized protein n=1 Tax=Albugo candida TaxID=65357 RepID=A0A024FVK8_9STRA|nr:unnamed protein product [Albugo candida]|eukprot:CCI11051.1 unnamed protein product [Albugo candida]
MVHISFIVTAFAAQGPTVIRSCAITIFFDVCGRLPASPDNIIGCILVHVTLAFRGILVHVTLAFRGILVHIILAFHVLRLYFFKVPLYTHLQTSPYLEIDLAAVSQFPKEATPFSACLLLGPSYLPVDPILSNYFCMQICLFYRSKIVSSVYRILPHFFNEVHTKKYNI